MIIVIAFMDPGAYQIFTWSNFKKNFYVFNFNLDLFFSKIN